MPETLPTDSGANRDYPPATDVSIPIPDSMTEEDVKRILKKASKQPSQSAGGDLVIFKEIESGHNQMIRVYRDIFKEREMLSIRRFYRNDVEEWAPAKGVTFHDEDVDDLIEGLRVMNEWLAEDRAPHKKASEEITQQGDD